MRWRICKPYTDYSDSPNHSLGSEGSFDTVQNKQIKLHKTEKNVTQTQIINMLIKVSKITHSPGENQLLI